MKKLTPVLFFFFLTLVLNAQNRSERSVTVFEPHQLNQIKMTMPDGQEVFKGACLADVPLENIEPFLAYSIVWYTQEWTGKSKMNAQFKDQQTRTVPQLILKETHAVPQKGEHISQLYFTNKEVKKVRLGFTNTTSVERIEIHFFNPGKTEKQPSPVQMVEKAACICPHPDYLDRLGWCPDGSCPEDATPAITTVTHLIVHHSAGSNSSSDWAATVRSIYDFHVFTNGWDDIGYNWLIDPNGVIYQGRGDNVRGAHFCGNNTGTMGVCVLGDFTDVLPMPDAVSSLQDLLAWKICDVNVTADGSAFHASSNQTLMHISGHRDGCATQCPGNTFYPTFNDLRDSVKWVIDNECDTTVLNDTYMIDESTVEVFPNPTDGMVNVVVENDLFGEMSVSVFNVMGEAVLPEVVFEKNNAKEKVEVDLSDLRTGVYFLKVRQAGQERLVRVVRY